MEELSSSLKWIAQDNGCQVLTGQVEKFDLGLDLINHWNFFFFFPLLLAPTTVTQFLGLGTDKRASSRCNYNLGE